MKKHTEVLWALKYRCQETGKWKFDMYLFDKRNEIGEVPHGKIVRVRVTEIPRKRKVKP
jgi:hypothetical protein